jgi:hypothetical protein
VSCLQKAPDQGTLPPPALMFGQANSTSAMAPCPALHAFLATLNVSKMKTMMVGANLL